MTTIPVTRSRPQPLESKSRTPPRVAATASRHTKEPPSRCQRYTSWAFSIITWSASSIYAWMYPPKKLGPIDHMAKLLKDKDLTAEKAKKCYLRVCRGYLGNRAKLDRAPTELLQTFWEQLIAMQAKAKMPPLARAIHSLNRLLMDDISPQDAKAMSVDMVADINRIKNIKDDPLYALFQEKAAAVDKKAKSPAPRPAPTPQFTTVQPFIGMTSGGANNCWINSMLQYIFCNDDLFNWLVGDQSPKELANTKAVLIAMEEQRLKKRATCSVPSSKAREEFRALFNRVSISRVSASGMEDAHEGFSRITSFLQTTFGRNPTFVRSALVTKKKIVRHFRWGAGDTPPIQGSTDFGMMTRVDLSKREGTAVQPGIDEGSNEILLTLPDDLDSAKPGGGWPEQDGAELILSYFAHDQAVTKAYKTERGDRNFQQHSAEARYSAPPAYLFVTASRYEFSGARTKKKNILINMPLTPITIPGKHFSFSLEPGEHPANQRYELSAMIRHTSTSAKTGHYIAYFKKDGHWYELNDSVGKRISDAEAARHAKSAYLYQFRRVD